MYVLTVEGWTSAPDELREHVATWPAEVGESAPLWLGNTAGIDTEGRFVMLLRFASEEAAFMTADLAESERWWRRVAELCDEGPEFAGSTDVTGILAGGSDEAAEVLITRGVADAAALADHWRRFEDLPPAERTGIFGGYVAWQEDGFTEVLYMTGEPLAPAEAELRAQHDALVSEPQVTGLDRPVLMRPAAGAVQ